MSVDLEGAIRLYTLAKTTLESDPGMMGGQALASQDNASGRRA